MRRDLVVAGAIFAVLLAALPAHAHHRPGHKPRPTPTPTPEPAPPGTEDYPDAASTGTPAGWTPSAVHTTDVTIRTAGAVVQDIQIDNANLYLLAPNITVRRVRMRGGIIYNATGSTCQGQGAMVEDSDFRPPPGMTEPARDHFHMAHGGYTLRNVDYGPLGDGPRVSYRPEGCGPVTILDSYIKVYTPAQYCDKPGVDGWHTDGIQGWYGAGLTIRNTVLDAGPGGLPCPPSRAFFYPGQQGNTGPVTIDRLLASGGAITFDLTQGPATVSGLRLEDRSWTYYPVRADCSQISAWGAKVVTISRPDYRVTGTVRDLPCS
jgi:hypothetical protein